MADFLELVGARIRGCRKAAGITQAMLAGRSELHTTYVSDIERGRAKSLSLIALMEIAQVLDVEIKDLVDVGEETKTEIEEKLSFSIQGIKKLEPRKQVFILNVLEKMVEEIGKVE